ncbi:MAG: energy transducer TonB [Gemmatimonadales bacterium]
MHRPDPRHPPLLQHAGIEGFVEAQFVVDTSGHVELNSWKVVASSHSHFELPAREALQRSRFRPARINGRPVCQLVQQRFVFAITP